jgi:hypothetical protein
MAGSASLRTRVNSNVRPHMQAIAPRPLTTEETGVIAALLARAPLGEPCAASGTNLAALCVVGRCECGCDSLFFTGYEASTPPYRIADGLGYTTDQEEIGLILWAAGDSPVHLELYNYAEHPARLPPPDSVCSFDASVRSRS